MKLLLVIFSLSIFSLSAQAIVDMKNANFSDTWTDLVVPGSGYDLRIQRTYNSRTLYNGLFGFGWCSDFETKLEITAEGNIKITECGGGLELVYKPMNYSEKQLDATINQIVAEVKKRNPSLNKKYLDNLKEELKVKTFFREELTRQLGIKGNVKQGQNYYADGRKDERVFFKSGAYTRYMPDGTYQKYDKSGQLTALYDKNGNFIKITYKGPLITKVQDNNGRSLNFQYHTQIKKVKSISGPGGLKADYKYEGEDLKYVKNGYGNTFTYRYDDLHNLVQITFPDKTSKALTYNKDKDWVTSFKDRSNCLEKYNYEENPKDPLNHYWSTVVKTCDGKVTNRSRYEFVHKFTAKGKRYLHQAKSVINGRTTDIYYHERFGKPILVSRNGIKVRYKYYKTGMVEQKVEPTRITDFSYRNKCNKVSDITAKYFGYEQKKKSKKVTKKLIKTVKTKFTYQVPKCNLLAATNSDGQKVSLTYDRQGRIAKIIDQSKKIVSIQYESRFGKPSVVTRPSVGTINISYKSDGSINKVTSKDGPSVAAQVASVFNNLLEIIAPATSELSI